MLVSEKLSAKMLPALSKKEIQGLGDVIPEIISTGGQRWIVQLYLNLHELSFDRIHINMEMAFTLLLCLLSNLMMTTLTSQIIHSKVFWKLPCIDTKSTPISEMGYHLFK